MNPKSSFPVSSKLVDNTKSVLSMNNSKKINNNNSDSLFYILTAAGVAGILGGLYYLYYSFSEEELDEKETIEIEEIKQDIANNDKKLSQDTAIKALYLVNHRTEEELKKTKPDLEKRRRDAINNEEEYKKICMECLEAKESIYLSSSNLILSQFNITMEEIEKMLQTADPMYVEKKFFEFETPKFDSEKPDKAKSKEIFTFYTNKYLEEMNELSNQMKNMGMNYNPQMQQMAMFSMISIKMKVEDLTYIKYKITEQQIRYLLNYYNLLEDSDVKQLQNKLTSFEGLMGP